MAAETTCNDEMYRLSEQEVEYLSHKIVATNMESLSLGYLRLDSTDVQNAKETNQGKAPAMVRELLLRWVRMHPEIDQRKVLCGHFPFC